jgi:hypothetical protein
MPTVVHFRNRMPVVPDDRQFARCRGLSALAIARHVRDQTVGDVGYATSVDCANEADGK